jgi:acyl carrier protein
MVPGVFVMLDRLPLTPNGKLDFRALPKLQGDRPRLEAAYVAPQSELERNLAAIWQEALHLDKVGIHDNFFDLGGHSILLIRVQSRLEELLKQNVAMIELFEYPTISTLARHLTQKGDEPSLLALDDRIEKRTKGRDRLKQKLRLRQQALSGQAEANYE